MSNGARVPSEALEGLLKIWVDDDSQVPDVIGALVHAGARIHSAARHDRPLEEVYLELVRS